MVRRLAALCSGFGLGALLRMHYGDATIPFGWACIAAAALIWVVAARKGEGSR